MFAVCNNCKNHIIKNRGNSKIWYNNFCGAKELPIVRDPLTGEETHQGVNDFGGKYTTDDKFEYCRSINPDGSCEFYKD